MNREDLIGQLTCTVNNRVDYVEFGSVAPGLDNEGPQVDVRSENVRSPGKNELRMPELFRLHTVTGSDTLVQSGRAGGGTDRPIQAGCAHTVEEPAVHPRPVQHAHRSGVAVRQNRFTSPFLGD